MRVETQNYTLSNYIEVLLTYDSSSYTQGGTGTDPDAGVGFKWYMRTASSSGGLSSASWVEITSSRVCEPWLHTRLNTVYACIHLDLALPPRTRPRHGAPPEGEGPARRLQGAGGESGTPTRTAPTARATSSIWPSRARAASCEARGSEGGRGAAGARYKGGGVSGSYSNYSRFRGRLSEYMYSCIIQVFRS